MAGPSVQAILNLFKSKPELLAGPGGLAKTTVAAGVSRPTVDSSADPVLVYATLDYKPESFQEAFQGWKEIVTTTEKNEPKVHMYNALKDSETDNRVRMFEAYEDMATFQEHCSTDILKKKMADEKGFQAKEVEVVFLKRVKGFLYRGPEREDMQRL